MRGEDTISNRFHNKFHRHNHHTYGNPNPNEPDAARDSIASPEDPFHGDFVMSGALSASVPPASGYAAVFKSNQYAICAIGLPDVYSDTVTTPQGNPGIGIYANSLYAKALTAVNADFTNLTADILTVNIIDITYAELSGFNFIGAYNDLTIPANAPSTAVILSSIPLSGNSWASFVGDVETQNNLIVSADARVEGALYAGAIQASGSNLEVQFNDNGFINGDPGLTYDKSIATLGVTTLSALNTNTIAVATTGISLGSHATPISGIHVTEVHFEVNASEEPVWEEGMVFYNAEDEALTFYPSNSAAALNIGQETWIKAVNKTGGVLLDGTVVAVSGVQGNRAKMTPADATNIDIAHRTIGIVTHDVPNNEEGFVTVFGLVRGQDTSAFIPDDILYTSTITGALTNTKLEAPLHSSKIGIALNSHATQGLILVDPDILGELDQMHDIKYLIPSTSFVGGEGLRWNVTNARWENNLDWESARTTVNANSATWQTTVDLTSSVWSQVNTTSADWSSSYTTVNANSATWQTTVDLTSSVWSQVNTTSADWSSSYTTVNANSATWQTTVDLTSSVWSLVNTTSASWDADFENDIDLNCNNINAVAGLSACGNLSISSYDVLFHTDNTELKPDTTGKGIIFGWQSGSQGAGIGVYGAADANSGQIYYNSGTVGQHIFQIDAAEAGRIDNSGRFGLGETAPGEKLTVAGNISSSNVIYDNSSNSTRWGSSYTTVNANSATWQTTVDLTSSVWSQVNTTSADWSSSYTTVNANSASWDADFESDIDLNCNNINAVAGLSACGNLSISSYDVLFNTDNTELKPDTTGKGIIFGWQSGSQGAGIGVYGAADANSGQIYYNSGTVGQHIFQIDAAEAGRINNAGLFGFGTTSPAEKLSVVGNISASGLIYDGTSDSGKWGSTHTIVNANSANWTGTHTTVNANSANWAGTHTTVNANSAVWDGKRRSTIINSVTSYNVGTNQTGMTFILTATNYDVTFVLPSSVSISDLGTNYMFVKEVSSTILTVSSGPAQTIDDSGLGATIYSGSTAASLSAGQQPFALIEVQLITPTQWIVTQGRKTWSTTTWQ